MKMSPYCLGHDITYEFFKKTLRYIKILVITTLGMDEKETAYFSSLGASAKIIYVLKSHESFGGPQSSKHLQKTLRMKRKNLDSLLSRLVIKGRIIRIKKKRYPPIKLMKSIKETLKSELQIFSNRITICSYEGVRSTFSLNRPL